MAFIIVPDNYTVGSSGKQLGAFTPETVGPDDNTFAVEFDTWENTDVHDPNGNHVGLDLKNITSFVYNNASSVGVQLNDGSVITAWIKYNGTLKNLQVSISTDSMEPIMPLIDANVSFTGIFNEYMYVGFSGSTGLSNESHTLMSWTFSSWGLQNPSTSSSATSATPLRRNRNVTAIVVTVCMIFILVALALGFLSWRTGKAYSCTDNYFRRANYYESKLSMYRSPRAFTYKELYAATKGFNEKQKLGIGSCYKGVLTDSGSVVAVKQVAKDAHEGLEEILREVQQLSSAPHQNLVPLQGWCLEKGEFLIVYEFIPNESLDKFLFNDNFDVLSWSQRYHIIIGLASGLAHMHGGLHLRGDGKNAKYNDELPVLIHRNVKPSNVMLDNNFNARLGDYGLRRLVRAHRKEDHVMVLEGTFGYIAPEVVVTGKVTTKADVFSFGILVLEVASGRRALSDEVVLLDMVWELEREGQILTAADERLKGCFDVQEMKCLLYLGLLCTLPDPGHRPSMAHVHEILLGNYPMPELPRTCKQQLPPSLASLNNCDKVRPSLQISIDELLSI
ncbi:hypothetical protein KP509_22G027300 [Ceratopteris richardii]|nr:hypothetical protein KP509_22G027300 [Ceratopteris richardii]